MRETADFEILGVFDITVNGVLVHSRKCDSHSYGQVGHLWLRNDKARQTAVWQAVQSALLLENAFDSGPVTVRIAHCSYYSKHSKHVSDMIRSWFPRAGLHVYAMVDDSSRWNFEVSVNGVVLHSMLSQGHGFFHDDWDQQCLIWKAIKGLLSYDQAMGA